MLNLINHSTVSTKGTFKLRQVCQWNCIEAEQHYFHMISICLIQEICLYEGNPAEK